MTQQIIPRDFIEEVADITKFVGCIIDLQRQAEIDGINPKTFLNETEFIRLVYDRLNMAIVEHLGKP